MHMLALLNTKQPIISLPDKHMLTLLGTKQPIISLPDKHMLTLLGTKQPMIEIVLESWSTETIGSVLEKPKITVFSLKKRIKLHVFELEGTVYYYSGLEDWSFYRDALEIKPILNIYDWICPHV